MPESLPADRRNARSTNTIEVLVKMLGRNSPAPGNAAKVINYSDVDSDSASTIFFQITYLTDDTTFVPINGATIS